MGKSRKNRSQRKFKRGGGMFDFLNKSSSQAYGAVAPQLSNAYGAVAPQLSNAYGSVAPQLSNAYTRGSQMVNRGLYGMASMSRNIPYGAPMMGGKSRRRSSSRGTKKSCGGGRHKTHRRR